MINKGPFTYLFLRRLTVEKTNQNENPNINNDMAEEETKKKLSWQTLAVPVIVAIIIAAFIGVVYYGKFVEPRKKIDKQVGYRVEEYIQLDKYTGLDYEITQDVFDECVHEETDEYEETERAAEDEDMIDFNYTAYVDGKKDSNISQEQAEITVGQEGLKVFATFSDAIKGHKSGDKFKVKVPGADVTEISDDGSDYTGKEVTFEIKINSISKLSRAEVTDKWVRENYFEDMGLETADDFYQWCKEYIIDEAKLEVWQKVLDSATMSGYPQELYDDIVIEFTQNANYYAEEFGITTESYLKDFCGYTDETLEEEYLNEVKSELVMWYIVKDQRFESTDAEIEEKYEELYYEMGYETVDEMKQEYTKAEMQEAVLLDEVQNYVFENSNIKENFKLPN